LEWSDTWHQNIKYFLSTSGNITWNSRYIMTTYVLYQILSVSQQPRKTVFRFVS
jgi:hypothetical protein